MAASTRELRHRGCPGDGGVKWDGAGGLLQRVLLARAGLLSAASWPEITVSRSSRGLEGDNYKKLNITIRIKLRAP